MDYLDLSDTSKRMEIAAIVGVFDTELIVKEPGDPGFGSCDRV